LQVIVGENCALLHRSCAIRKYNVFVIKQIELSRSRILGVFADSSNGFSVSFKVDRNYGLPFFSLKLGYFGVWFAVAA
jgi:hypothetical protein